ncbi:WAP four-disulfide core domain protein 2 [Elephas maximus indicus]|uniref:WAP four-disulfide core domain protein 2 n=1 Tax=Elephas maximus indicus TaxID=99487 RepID=UPI00211725C4|nr:WAP four-disulfide core domain protein 2 [Elephas maximus indicus]
MPASRLGPLAAALLLGLLLLGLPPVRSDTETQKAGVCPELQGDLNCTEECVSDRDCADNLKCCRAGCVAVCVLPNEKPGSCPQLSSGFLPLGFCHDLCQVDSQCPGQKKCCLNGCGNAYCATPHF